MLFPSRWKSGEKSHGPTEHSIDEKHRTCKGKPLKKHGNVEISMKLEEKSFGKVMKTWYDNRN